MAKRTPLEKLSDTISKTLDAYGEEVTRLTADSVKSVTRAGVAALKGEAMAKFEVDKSSEYVKGWTSTVESGRMSTQGIIYNRLVPGLPHLLEYGHVSRNGTGRTFGTVEGRPHIEPVQKVLGDELIKTLRRKL